MKSYADTLDHNASMARKPKSELAAIEMKKTENGGVVANHRMTRFDGKEPVHAFGPEDGHLLAAHLEEHLGIKMPHGAAEEPAKEADGDAG